MSRRILRDTNIKQKQGLLAWWLGGPAGPLAVHGFLVSAELGSHVNFFLISGYQDLSSQSGCTKVTRRAGSPRALPAASIVSPN